MMSHLVYATPYTYSRVRVRLSVRTVAQIIGNYLYYWYSYQLDVMNVISSKSTGITLVYSSKANPRNPLLNLCLVP